MESVSGMAVCKLILVTLLCLSYAQVRNTFRLYTIFSGGVGVASDNTNACDVLTRAVVLRLITIAKGSIQLKHVQNLKPSRKRQTAEMCTGCPIEFDPSTEPDKGFDKAIQATLNSANSEHPLHLVRFTHATKHLVNGVIYSFDVVTTTPGNENKVQTCHMSYMWRPWVNKELELMNENCTYSGNEIREDRQLLGGLKEVDPSEMDTVQQLADYAIKTLDNIDTDNSKQVVTKIVDAKKQLVNGIMYHLQLRVKTTKCAEDVPSSNGCLINELEPEKFCKVQIHRSWADKSPFNAKVVKSECEVAGRTLGGLVPLNTNSGDILKLADLAVERYNMMTNCLTMAGLVGVVKASTQAVAGNNVYLTLEVGDTNCHKNSYSSESKCEVIPNNSDKHTVCDVVVWQKPWENFKKITDLNCRSIYSDMIPNERRKRDTFVGGPTQLDPNDSYVLELTQFALLQMDKTTNSEYRLGYKDIISVTSQVVSGKKMTIKMSIGTSTCQKGVPTNGPCKADSSEKVCEIVIWDQPWKADGRKILSEKCDAGITKRELKSGAPHPVSPNDRNVKELAGLALIELDETTNSNYRLGLVKIVKASTQVISGIKTTITMEIGESSCRKGEQTNNPCNGNSVEKICTVQILEQSWLNRRELTDTRCESPHKTKRAAIGGWTDISVDDKDIVAQKDYVGRQVTNRLNSPSLKKVVKIISASTQVVAGTNTKLVVELADTDCRRTENKDPSQCNIVPSNSQDHEICEVTIWEQSWLNKKEITNLMCHKQGGRPKREEGNDKLKGAPEPADPNSPSIQKMSQFALTEMDKKTNSNFKLGIHHIIKATSQVVSGFKYSIEMAVGDSSCLKGQESNGPCNAKNAEKVCTVEIWEQSWLNKLEILSSNCENARTKRQVGGVRDVDVNDRRVTALKPFVAGHISGQANSIWVKGIVKVLKASVQVVAGTKTTMTVEVSDTDCLKMKSKDPSHCNIVPNNSGNHEICEVTVWEKPWENFKEVTKSNCHNVCDSRQKRAEDVPVGAPVEVDPDSITELCTFALEEMDKTTNSNFKLGIHHIIKARSQVVSGIKYTIEFVIGDSSCVKGKDSNSSCMANNPEKQLGGAQEVDVNDERVTALKPYIANRISNQANSIWVKGIVKVLKASVQVVAGTKTTLTVEVSDTDCLKNKNQNPSSCNIVPNNSGNHEICEVTVWEKPWENFKEITKSSCRNIRDEDVKSRKQRQIPGGPSTVDPRDPKIQQLSRYIVQELSKTTNSVYKLGLHNVISAKKQVVAGIKTTVEIAVGDSSCKKGVPSNGPCNAIRAEKVCVVVVWDQPSDKREILSSNCRTRSTRSLGGETQVDVNDIDAETKDFVGREITKRANSDNVKTVVKVIKASTQVVSGELTKLTVEVADTDCLKTENKDVSQCHVVSTNSEDHQICEITIWEQAWLNKREVTKSECHNSRSVRQ